jgi:hypothetical protein
MELLISAFAFVFVFLFLVHGYLEITPVKYGVLKAMASQSERASRTLHELLEIKSDYKISNKDFKKVEKIYINDLNRYLFQFRGADVLTLRREILMPDRLEL